VLACGCLLVAAGLWLIFNTPHNLARTCGALVLTGVGMGLVDTPALALLSSLAAKGQEGSVVAVQDIAVNLGFALGPLVPEAFPRIIIAGGDEEEFFRAGWVMGGMCCLALPLLAYVYKKEKEMLDFKELFA